MNANVFEEYVKMKISTNGKEAARAIFMEATEDFVSEDAIERYTKAIDGYLYGDVPWDRAQREALMAFVENALHGHGFFHSDSGKPLE